jgi:hypothetical protein
LRVPRATERAPADLALFEGERDLGPRGGGVARVAPEGLGGGTRVRGVARIPGQDPLEISQNRDLGGIDGPRVRTVTGGEIPGCAGNLTETAGAVLLHAAAAVGLRAIGGHWVDGPRPSGPAGLAAEAGYVIPFTLRLILGGDRQR